MICHIVLGKERTGLSNEERQVMEKAIASLQQIEGVRNFTCGRDFSGRAKGYEFGAVMYFDDRAGLEAYLIDEHHLAVVQALNRLLPERLIMDYEIPGNET